MNNFNNQEGKITPQHLDSPESAASKIPVLEERLNIGVRQVETGAVQIHKKIISEEVTRELPVIHEEVQVEHVAFNQYVEAAPAVRYEGDTTIISVVKEVLVVEKRLMLVEEIHLTKKQITTSTVIKETLWKEEIEVNRIAAQDSGLPDTQDKNTTNQ